MERAGKSKGGRSCPGDKKEVPGADCRHLQKQVWFWPTTHVRKRVGDLMIGRQQASQANSSNGT